MPTALTINGVVYNYPITDDSNWGSDATNWAVAVTNGMLTKAGGVFTLTGEVDFGASFGLKAPYLKASGTPIATTGFVRMTKTDVLAWRNNAGSGDNTLGFTTGNALAINGIALTGSGTVTSVGITQPATGITATGGPITGSGNITLTLTNNLLGVESISTNGVACRIGAATWAARIVQGTGSRLSVANGDGIAGNITLDIDAGYVGQTSITTLGTVAFGTWNATTITALKGGTGWTSYAKGDILAGGNDGALYKIAAGTDAQVLVADSSQFSGVKWSTGPIGKNAIINGAFNIWQRATSFVSIADGAYSADRWIYGKSGVAVHDISRSTDVPSVAQAGRLYQYSILVDCQTIDASITATDVYLLSQIIEGFNWVPFAQRALTISFWVKATKTGIYCVSLRNSGLDRSFVAEYTVNVTDTWEKKTVAVTASPSAGTWDYATGAGAYLGFTLAGGSNKQGTNNTWNSANNTCTANQVNACDSITNNFRITGVQVETGSVATEFEPTPYSVEMLRCRRYYQTSLHLTVSAPIIIRGDAVGTCFAWIDFLEPMRNYPTVSTAISSNSNTSGQTVANVSPTGYEYYQTLSALSGYTFFDWFASAEL